MSEPTKTVWLIEDNDGDAQLYERLLERSHQLDVESVGVHPSVDDYAYLVADPRTGAVLIDHHLSDGAGVPYEGTDVAEFLRMLRAELPIYILTNYGPDAEEQGSDAADSIIDKQNVRKHTEVYIARILRGMQRYDEALTGKKQRIKELVDKKIASGLNEEEERELTVLRADISRPVDLPLARQTEQHEVLLQQKEQQIGKLQDLASHLLDELKRSSKKG
jgi:hypothetical protein